MAELAKAPTVSQEGDLFVLDLGDGENRLNADWMDAVESAIGAAEAAAPPRALVTVASGKFWSNGLDLEWMAANPEAVEGFVDEAAAAQIVAEAVGEERLGEAARERAQARAATDPATLAAIKERLYAEALAVLRGPQQG